MEHAEEDCLRAIELADRSAYRDSLGFVYLRLRRYEESIDAYDAALDLRANYAYSLFGHALARRALGDEKGYEEDMVAAEQQQPEIRAAFERYGVTR